MKKIRFNLEQIKFLSLSFRIFGVTIFLSSVNQKSSVFFIALYLFVWVIAEMLGFLTLKLIDYLPNDNTKEEEK